MVPDERFDVLIGYHFSTNFSSNQWLGKKGYDQTPYFAWQIGLQPRFEFRVSSAGVTEAVSHSDLDVCWGLGADIGCRRCGL